MSSTSVQLTDENGDLVQIDRVPGSLPVAEAKELGQLRRAMRNNPRINLSDEAIEVAVGGFLDIPRLTILATHKDNVDGLTSFYAGATQLLVLEGLFDAESFSTVLGNPRLSGQVKAPPAPAPTGVRNASGELLAQLKVEYDSPAHARKVVEDVARETLRQEGADYRDSVLSNGVMTPVEAVLTEAHYADNSPPTLTAALIDGTSRYVSAAAARHYNPEATTPAEQTRTIVSTFGNSFAASRTARRRTYNRDAERHNAALARDGLTMGTLRQLQTRAVPVRLIVGAVLNEDDADDVLADAVATAQSSRHISINRWSDAAQDAMTARRMVNHLLHRRMVSPAFAALVADEELTAEQIASLVPGRDTGPMYGPDGRIHPLWRAVLIVHTLTRYKIFDEAKRFIRSDRGFGQVRDDRYAGFLGVLIDMPWRAAKQATTDVARRAWRNGGVLYPGVFSGWEPLPASAETLRKLADDGDANAQHTLTVLAGTALLADAVLTRDTGSKVDDGRVPYRATPPVVLAPWTSTVRGRWQAKTVVETFDPNKAGGTGEGKSVQAHYTYAHVNEVGEPIPDGATHEILLEKHLFTQANPERAADEQKQRRQEQMKREAEQKITREERNEKSRINLLHTIGEARAVVDRLTAEAADFPSPLTEHPMGGLADWKQVRESLRDLEDALLEVRPPAETAPTRLRDADRQQV
ncbi:hypothetical protein GTY20_09055 [Streptomyces sp. SID4946]|uniref:hypothetical protein n=1 Tax=Streptomyces sp. LamerLS-31b TaxID=1839765 RepID=UPI00081F6B2E|nr:MULTISPECIES: hypothetical protein [unclassified Streptomyces]MYQ91465.1 hypothetical protein [Streptomyces sp. SID4946]SCF67713.1 hypothetical protein GA0115256_111315 [Streptomyces sp. DconLS]SCF79466.1 hypothetical protein GA0115258_112578 [Streptomyces sp. LamerLS-31b]